MSSYAEQHLLYKLANMQVLPYPYPHFYVENVFPADFYARILEHFPGAEAMPRLKDVRPVGGGYSEQRMCVPVAPEHIGKLPQASRQFWEETAQWLLGHGMFTTLMQKFQPLLEERFSAYGNVTFNNEALLVDDRTRFSLGPHSDSPKKVLTLLFYLPRDLSQEHLGTSIYLPRDPNFRCRGGPHYPLDQFHRVFTAPFRPNSLFGFLKTNNSFHGVEPLQENEACRRWLLLYDINVPVEFGLGVPPAGKVVAPAQPGQPQTAPAPGAGAGASPSTPNVNFTF